MTRSGPRGRQDDHILLQDGSKSRRRHTNAELQDCILHKHSHMQTQSGQASHIGRKARSLHSWQTHGPYLQDQHALRLIPEPNTTHAKVGPKCKAEVANHHPATVVAILAVSRSTDTI